MSTKQNILQLSLVNAVINGIINGLINWFSHKGQDAILLGDNLISSDQSTILSGAVPLATSLAFILTSITFLTSKTSGKPPYFPKVFLLSLRNAVFAFGLAAIISVLTIRSTGLVYLSPVAGALVTGLFAAVVGGIVTYLTTKELSPTSK